MDQLLPGHISLDEGGKREIEKLSATIGEMLAGLKR
jgi:hypothetical protein